MRIRFQFHPEKAVQAAGYLLERLGGASDKVRLMKLMYLADRDHFLAQGRPITGDMQYALPHGPCPTCTLNLLAGLDPDQNDYVFKHITTTKEQFRLEANPGTSCLEPSEIEVLDAVLSRYGSLHTWPLRKLTHDLPEYIECEVGSSSALIPYEVILRHHGGPQGFRSNRPVISPQMAAHMLCPFPQSEPDL